MSNAKRGVVVVTLVSVGVFAASIALFGSIWTQGTPSSPTVPLDHIAEWVAEYGGVEHQYKRILNMTNCHQLQAELDTFAEAHDGELPGTALHKATLGYMMAAPVRVGALRATAECER